MPQNCAIPACAGMADYCDILDLLQELSVTPIQSVLVPAINAALEQPQAD